jgi:hypothetical protein
MIVRGIASKTTNLDPPPPLVNGRTFGGGPIWILCRRSGCADLSCPDLHVS